MAVLLLLLFMEVIFLFVDDDGNDIGRMESLVVCNSSF